jgi:hypothetical protein
VKTDQPTTDPDIDFSSLPQVDQTARPPVQRRPRFDGDVSELPDRACWALQHLLTRRYISAEADADVYCWVLEYRKELSVRLSELDLLLRIVDGTDVAFVEQARYESARGIKLLRREPLGTYDSILALHLAQMMRASGGQTVLISREEMRTGCFLACSTTPTATRSPSPRASTPPSRGWPAWRSCVRAATTRTATSSARSSPPS